MSLTAYMEFVCLLNSSPFSASPYNFSQADLRKAADDSQIPTFGWPIGLVLTSNPGKPVPYRDGIKATILSTHREEEQTFDYWNIHRNGHYYMLKSLFEDTRKKGVLFVDTRTYRITETFMHMGLLYSALKVSPQTKLTIRMTHYGLQGRTLAVASGNRHLSGGYQSQENEIVSTYEITVKELETKLNDLVYDAVSTLTTVFDFFKVGQSVVNDMVEGFKKGQIK